MNHVRCRRENHPPKTGMSERWEPLRVAVIGAGMSGILSSIKLAALEGAPHGIRVSTVNPSAVERLMTRSLEEGSVYMADGGSTAK